MVPIPYFISPRICAQILENFKNYIFDSKGKGIIVIEPTS